MRPSASLSAAALVVSLALAISGCSVGRSAPQLTAPSPSSEASQLAATSPTSSSATAAAWTQAAWATAQVTDVRSGDTFRIADLAGKVVFIETMAVWCVNCGIQQQAAQEALASLDPARVAWVALDVDPGESADLLRGYADDRGFGFTYALAGRDMSRALSDAFGSQVLSPPSTPVIVIGTDGRVTDSGFGQKSPERLVELALEHGA